MGSGSRKFRINNTPNALNMSKLSKKPNSDKNADLNFYHVEVGRFLLDWYCWSLQNLKPGNEHANRLKAEVQKVQDSSPNDRMPYAISRLFKSIGVRDNGTID